MTEQEIIQELINRYRKRIKEVWSNPSPYYQYPVWEKSEIESKISQLQKLIK